MCVDLEQDDWLANFKFDLVLVSTICTAEPGESLEVGPGGFLVTKPSGSATSGEASNADFLLTPNELRDSVGNEFLIMDEFFGEVREPQPVRPALRKTSEPVN